MTIRKQSDLPIWLFSRTEVISKVNRIIYLQLGADGVFDYSYDRQECMLSMSNLLQRVKDVLSQISYCKRGTNSY